MSRRSSIGGDDHEDESLRSSLDNLVTNLVVYYESINRELKTEPIYECRCDERLKSRVEESTHLTFTQFCLL